ncbi:MAG: NUDIX hydrolase [Candidatus Thorarchaeota archaeon]
MNELSSSEIETLVRKYGSPQHLEFSADFLDFECELVRRSVRGGRNHDITCFILHDGKYVVIQKHAYSGTGIFRAPSGGAHPGEPLELAAAREMMEETGLEIRLMRFVLDVSLTIRCHGEIIPWRSLVFLAESVAGHLGAVDTEEICSVTTMSREEMLGDVDSMMDTSGWGGFKYRSFLTRAFFRRLDELGELTRPHGSEKT